MDNNQNRPKQGQPGQDAPSKDKIGLGQKKPEQHGQGRDKKSHGQPPKSTR